MSSAIRIGYQGIKGSFSYQVVAENFPDDNYRGYLTFQEVFQGVEKDDIDCAVIPVENSTAGRVMEVYNLLPDSGLYITGEYLLPIHHCLMIPQKSFRGAPPANIEGEDIIKWKGTPITTEERAQAYAAIREVHSHQQAIAQCRKYLNKHLPKANARSTYDTAGSARDIANRTDAEIAAIASKTAGEIYNMIILEENIEDIPNNTTRFLALTKTRPAMEDVAEPAITTLLFETSHKPGALLHALSVFEKHGINLTKLETYMSGPARPNPTFYVDVGANLSAPARKAVLDEFKKQTSNVHIMGCYPASARRGKDGGGFLAV